MRVRHYIILHYISQARTKIDEVRKCRRTEGEKKREIQKIIFPHHTCSIGRIE